MAGYRATLALPEFRRLFVAGLASASGGAVTAVCLLWVVYASTGSALAVGYLGTAELVAGILFSVVGGGLVDRYDRQRLMVVSDLVRAAAVAALALDLAVVGFSLPLVLAVAFVIGSLTTIFNPAEQTVIPAVVGPGAIADANGLVQSTRSMVFLAGSAAAGLLILSVGADVGLAYNAVTFLVSGLLIAGLRLGPEARRPGASRGRRPFLTEVAEGFRWLRGEAGLLQLTISAGFFNFFWTLVGTFLVVYSTVLLHGSAAVFGVLIAVQVGGQGAGALAVGRLGLTRWAGRVWVLAYGIGVPLTVLGMVLLPTFGAAIVLLSVGGFLGGLAGTAWQTTAQLTVPPEMQGRYFGVDSLGSWAIIPGAQIGGGILIAVAGVRFTYLLAAGAWLVIGALFLVPRALRRWRYPPRVGAPGPAKAGER